MSTPAPPTVTPHNQTGVTPGTPIALSTLFTYSFAPGDTVLGFDFKETTSNGDYITDPNGNQLTPGVLYGSAGPGIAISELSHPAAPAESPTISSAAAAVRLGPGVAECR